MRFSPLFAAALSLGSLSACAEEKQLFVSNGWVNLPTVAGRPGAAYFTVNGGPTADKLLSVTSEITLKTELHETVKDANGAMQMKPLPSIDIPAGGKVDFRPGGKHVMLYDLRPGTKAGGTIRLDFTFASGNKLYIDAPLLAPGTAPEGVKTEGEGHH